MIPLKALAAQILLKASPYLSHMSSEVEEKNKIKKKTVQAAF